MGHPRISSGFLKDGAQSRFYLVQPLILLLILVIFNIKDIVSPISIAYFFNCFSESDGNTAWALVGAIANTFSILSPIIIGMLFEKSIFLMEILIIISLLVTGIVGIILLPKQQKEGKN